MRVSMLALSLLFASAVLCCSLATSLVAGGKEKETVVTAVELTKAFAANEEAARKKYNGKTIVIEGKVLERSGKNVIDNFVILEGHAKKPKGTYRVECGFAFTEEADILKVKPGDMVKIRGESSLGWGTGKYKEMLTLITCKFVK
jgi:hypothetical protein